MKKTIAINGEFFARPKTGIERVAEDAVFALDKIARPGLFEIVVPKNILRPANFKNIKVVSLPFEIKFFPKWTQIHFQKYVIKNRRLPLDFANACPIFCPGIEYLHDIYARKFPGDFKTRRDRLVRLYSLLMYRTIARRAKKIVAVSQFAKCEIQKCYRVPSKKIEVVYNALSEEYKKIEADFSVMDDFPSLKKGEFFFTLGSLSERKNLKWIARHAELFPNEIFAVSGKEIPAASSAELQKLNSLKNVVLAGYLSDAKVKALMKNCRAFVFPSFYEGFGLPPLEALSCGAKIVVSNAGSLPEIYGRAAHYIDPNDPSADLNELLKNEVEGPDAVLEKFSFEDAAKKLHEICEEVAGWDAE